MEPSPGLQNDEARQEMNLLPNQKGVVIADVKQDSPTQMAGLQAGDVLEMASSQPVTNPQQAVNVLRSGTQKSGAVALQVLRDGQQAYVALSAEPTSEELYPLGLALRFLDEP